MARECHDCGEVKLTAWTKYGDFPLCRECREKRYRAEVEAKGAEVNRPVDLKEWGSGDMSELFWIHLGKYVKEPNPRSLDILSVAYAWACHDNHGLSNSFKHAMKWAGIDLRKEQSRWANERKDP